MDYSYVILWYCIVGLKISFRSSSTSLGQTRWWRRTSMRTRCSCSRWSRTRGTRKTERKRFQLFNNSSIYVFFTGGKDQGHGSGTKAEKRDLWKSTTPRLTKKTWHSQCTEHYHYHNISLSDESHACKSVRPKVREREKESETYLQQKIFAKPLRRFIWNQKLVLHMYYVSQLNIKFTH